MEGLPYIFLRHETNRSSYTVRVFNSSSNRIDNQSMARSKVSGNKRRRHICAGIIFA